MLKKLTAILTRRTSSRQPPDPGSFNDPVARATEWTPAKGGGTNFKTHRLVKVHSGRLEFRATISALFFYSVFILMGLGVGAAIVASRVSEDGFRLEVSVLLPMGIGLLFAAIGGSLMVFGTAPIVFDKNKGWYWKGRKAPDHVMDKRTLKHFCELKEIHAIQLLSEYIRGNKSSYYSYELNLVLEDGRRMNVVDHGSQNKIHSDASTLAEFLGVPIWE